MTTQIRSPQGLPYPIQIDKLIPSVGSYLHEGDRLLVYKFWYLVERASDTGDDDNEHDVSPAAAPEVMVSLRQPNNCVNP